MPLRSLSVKGLRNLCDARLDDCARINILSGPNGSGKTSFLEAIYLLGLGRSFRSRRNSAIINHDMEVCTVFGEMVAGVDACQNLGVLRSRSGQHALRINRVSGGTVAEAAAILPLQLINSETFGLVDGGPGMRRQFMDWGLFHVKPAFLGYWRRAQRCLKQRNNLLKEQRLYQHGRICSSDLAAWDNELALCATYIDQLRAQYVKDIYPLFDQILQRFVGVPEISFVYQRGWSVDQDLRRVLEENLRHDIKRGLTTFGPHRANIDVRVGNQQAMDILSRGQQKLVVASLKLAQGAHLAREHNLGCVYLIDDLAAELDKNHRALFCQLLDEINCQAFITGVDADIIENCWEDSGAVRRFHVKHGCALSITSK